MAVERLAIEVETTPMPVTPATAAEMKHWVSQVEAAGSEARLYLAAVAAQSPAELPQNAPSSSGTTRLTPTA